MAQFLLPRDRCGLITGLSRIRSEALETQLKAPRDVDNGQVPQKSAYPGVPVLSFCRFYIALLQVGLMSGAKIGHALSLTPNPAEPSERIQIDALIVALGMFVQVVCLDFLPYSDCKAQQSVGPQEVCKDGALTIWMSRCLVMFLSWGVGVVLEPVLIDFFQQTMTDPLSADLFGRASSGILVSVLMVVLGFAAMHRWPVWGRHTEGTEQHAQEAQGRHLPTGNPYYPFTDDSDEEYSGEASPLQF